MHSGVRRAFIGLAAFLCASQATAENWVTLVNAKFGSSTSVDKDSIRRGSDNLDYFTKKDENGIFYEAVDCKRAILYLVGSPTLQLDGWRKSGQKVVNASPGDDERKFVCSTAP